MDEKESDMHKGVVITLIILTVLVSAVSTWMLITSSMDSQTPSSSNSVLVHLNIFKSRAIEPVLSDANGGNARLIIAKSKGGI